MTSRTTVRWVVRAALILPTAALTLAFGASCIGLLPWSPINCTHYDVDIASGRIRTTRYLFFVCAHEVINDSALTKALLPEDYSASIAEWHHVVTRSPRIRHSPHYIFHGAISQIAQLELTWSLGQFTTAARRASARRVLQLWRRTGADAGAKPYLRALDALALAVQTSGRSIDAQDLPAEYTDSPEPSGAATRN